MKNQVASTATCTVKVKIPGILVPRLDSLLSIATVCIKRMLHERSKSSTKYYPELPSVVSKGLIAKYQKNRKCRSVSSIVLPICGDKEKQIKLVNTGVRIPSLFGKAVLTVSFPRPVSGDEKGRRNVSAEFFHRGGQWFVTFSYRTQKPAEYQPTGMIGVDRNSVGNVAVMADPSTGKVFHLGFNPDRTKQVWRGRKSNLQRKGKNRLLCRIKRKQSRRTTHENHKVSKAIVDYAATHRRAIVLEDLSTVRAKGSKIKSYTEKSQWAFYQLLQFVLYKAALRGVMVFQVSPGYTSQECSRCGELNKPAGKKYACSRCGHNDHRDANAAFTISSRVMPIGGIARESGLPALGLIGDPLSGNRTGDLGTASLMPPVQANGITELTL